MDKTRLKTLKKIIKDVRGGHEPIIYFQPTVEEVEYLNMNCVAFEKEVVMQKSLISGKRYPTEYFHYFPLI